MKKMDTRFVENLEIETADLEPGRCKLEMTITDLQSNQQAERSVDFEIVDP